MKKSFIIAHTGVKDSQNDIIMPGALKEKKDVWVLQEHDVKLSSAMGLATVYETKGGLMAETEIKSLSGLYPSIGFQAIESEDLPDGSRLIYKIELFCIGVHVQPNVDPTIPPIE